MIFSKTYLLDYIKNFATYDYVAFSLILTVCFFLFIISLLIVKKKPTTSVVIILLTILILPAGLFGTKYFLDNFVKKTTITNTKIQYLSFSKSLLVKATLTNNSKLNFQKCYTQCKVIKPSSKALTKVKNWLKPLAKQTKTTKKELQKDDTIDLKFVFNNFTHNDYNVTITTNCF